MVRTTAEVCPICFAVSDQVPNNNKRDAEQTYKQYGRNVQKKRYHGIGQKYHGAHVVNILQGQAGAFDENCEDGVGDGASRCVVVKRDERIHLEIGRTEEALDEDEAQRFSDDTANLEDKTPEFELDLSKRSNDHTQDNNGNVSKNLHVGWCDTKSPGGQEYSNRGCSLKGE